MGVADPSGTALLDTPSSALTAHPEHPPGTFRMPTHGSCLGGAEGTSAGGGVGGWAWASLAAPQETEQEGVIRSLQLFEATNYMA